MAKRRVQDLFVLRDDLDNDKNIIIAYGIMKVLKERYKDKAAKYFYYDNTFRSKIYRAINSIFSYIVINKSFGDFFDSRVKFYHALEFMFVHLNMSRMITYYRDPSLNIPKPDIMNSYVAINKKKFDIDRIINSTSTFSNLMSEEITGDMTISQERHMLVLQALFVLDDMVSNRVGLSATHYIDDRPIIKYPLSNKYKKRALNMLAENMFIHRAVIGAGHKTTTFKEGEKIKVKEFTSYSSSNGMEYVSPIKDNKATIKAFKKIKGFLYSCDRDNIEQTITFDKIDNKVVNLDEYL
ncbi:hypothetical protein [uncultured Gammaproteobacteria bacterium]|nr:hypothetical protein [uncultured Gammaproteobacteria bacterium]